MDERKQIDDILFGIRSENDPETDTSIADYLLWELERKEKNSLEGTAETPDFEKQFESIITTTRKVRQTDRPLQISVEQLESGEDITYAKRLDEKHPIGFDNPIEHDTYPKVTTAGDMTREFSDYLRQMENQALADNHTSRTAPTSNRQPKTEQLRLTMPDKEKDKKCKGTKKTKKLERVGHPLRGLILPTVVSGLLFVTLLLMVTLPEIGVKIPEAFKRTSNPYGYLTLNLVFTVLSVFLSRKTLWRGLHALFTLKPNGESGMSFAASAVLLHNILAYLDIQELEKTTVDVYGAVICMALFLDQLGKLIHAARVEKNYAFAASSGTKKSVCLYDRFIHGERFSNLSEREPTVSVCTVPITDIGGLKEFSEKPDKSQVIAQKITVLGIICAFAVGIIAAVADENHFLITLGVFSVMCCVAVPMTGSLSVNLPLFAEVKKLSKEGAYISGEQAAMEFGDINAVIAESVDLFSAGSCTLVKLERCSGRRDFQEVLDSIAVMLTRTESNLKHIFPGIADTNSKFRIDSVFYQENTGITGWIDGSQRVLAGNLQLMEMHGIRMGGFDETHEKAGKGIRTLYLAAEGELLAVCTVQYTAEPSLARLLKRLISQDIRFFIRTKDPLVTGILISEVYGIRLDMVRVMNPSDGREYEEKVRRSEREKLTSTIAATCGNLSQLCMLLLACTRLKSRITLAVAVQTAGICLGIALVGFIAICYGFTQLSQIYLMAYSLIWVCASLLLPITRSPF